MPNPYFQFKQFTVYHDRCAMKVTTDACLFGAWCAANLHRSAACDLTVLDIGTGTGLLSLMVAQQNKVRIDAVEIDPEAAGQAGENIAASVFSRQIIVHNQAIQEWRQGPYDCIISNPPFYEQELPSSQASKNTAHHGEGLRLEELFALLTQLLTPTGSFYLLLPHKRQPAIHSLLRRNNLFIEEEVTVYPAEGQRPFRLLLKGGKTAVTPTLSTLTIYDDRRQYTPAFTALLQPYYLYL